MSLDDEPPIDPFEGLTIDEAWAAGATLREPPARVREAQAAFARHDLEAEEREAQAWRARRRKRRRNRGLVLLGLLVFAGAVGIADRRDQPGATWTTSDLAGQAYLTLGGHPTPQPAASDEPLGRPADPKASDGDFAFLVTQADSADPVAYDPCRPVEIVINDDGAPPGAATIVKRAVTEAATITGLALTIGDPTDEKPEIGRAAYQPDRYGDRWAPILVAWSDEGASPELAGDVAGVGGSIPIGNDDGPDTYVSGMIVLDGPDAEAILEQEDQGQQVIEDIVRHELGHVLGLAHVGSEAELMYPEGQLDLHGYQQGDRAGLTRLGQGACIPLQ